MGNFFDSLGQFILSYPSWSYIIIAAGILIQGELTVLLAVYLIVNGNLSWGEFIIASVGSLLIVETIVYLAGRTIRHTRFGWKLYYKLKPNRKVQVYTYYLTQNLGKLFVIAKFLVGTNLIVLLLTGWTKTPFGRFFKSHFVSVSIWFVIMVAVSYSLATGTFLLKSEKVFRQVEIGAVGAMGVLFIGEYFLRRMLKRKMFTKNDLATLEEEEKEKI